MKKILLYVVASLMLFTHCTHPYTEDALGTVPFAELLSDKSYTHNSDAQELTLEIRANTEVSIKIEYDKQSSWIHAEVVKENGATVLVHLTVDENRTLESRNATVKLISDLKQVFATVKIGQNAYVLDDVAGNVHEGDLEILTQEDIKYCIYTTINGRLIIGNEQSDIDNLSTLDFIKEIKGGVVINGSPQLESLGPIGKINLPSLEFNGVNPDIFSTWKADLDTLIIKGMSSGKNVGLRPFEKVKKAIFRNNSANFYDFMGLKNVKVADFADNSFKSTIDYSQMTSLDTLILSGNPLRNVNAIGDMTWLKKVDLSRTSLSPAQVRYLKYRLTEETEILSDEISGVVDLKLKCDKVTYNKADFTTTISNYNAGVGRSGYIYTDKDEFPQENDWKVFDSFQESTVFEVSSLNDSTTYRIWTYVEDGDNSIYLSEGCEFTTPKIEYDIKDDVVLETQEDVDDCRVQNIEGNLIIGKPGSDIRNLSELSIISVTGGVTIRGCHDLDSFGKIRSFGMSYLELDDINPTLASSWDKVSVEGSVKDLRIRNIESGSIYLDDFTDVTHLTLENNRCTFFNLNKLTNLTSAHLRGNQFSSAQALNQMSNLQDIDLSDNPLTNVNTLVDMPCLRKVTLSRTSLSQSQVNYLRACLPSSISIIAEELTGNADFAIDSAVPGYRLVDVSCILRNLTISSAGYVLSENSSFDMDHAIILDADSLESDRSFKIRGLKSDTDYYLWIFSTDIKGSYHLSVPVTFHTKKIVPTYVGNLVLSTQDQVDDCAYSEIQGNLTISGGDITDLSSIAVRSVTGDLTIKSCSRLSDFGALKKLNVGSVTLDNTNLGIVKTWEGNAKSLTIKNIADASTYSLADFDEITSLTLTDNFCNFSGLESLVDLTSADLPRNKFGSTEGMDRWTKLTSLDLSGNPLANINELAQLTNLTSLDISNTSLSQTQVRYVTESLPSTVSIKSSGITGSGSLSVTNTGVDYFSASFSASISGISSVAGGYYINDDSSFPGESGRVEKVDINGDALTAFDAKTLENGTTYSLWYYVEDTYGSVHLSERISFTTNKVNYYSLTVTPSWPSFENDASVQSDFGSIRSNMLVYKESVVAGREDSMMSSGNAYSVELPEGMTAMGLFAVEGVAEGNNYDGYSWLSNMNMSSPVWTLTLDSETGSSSDIAVGYLSHDLQEDASLEVSFKRPVAKVTMSVDFSGSIGSLDKVDEISIRMKYHYTKCQFGNATAMSYSTQKDLVFTASDVVVPADKKVKVADERYVFPLNTYYSPSVSFTITFKDGTSKTVTPDVNTTINANKVYDFTFVTALTDSNGSFTVDVVEVVHDEIEF